MNFILNCFRKPTMALDAATLEKQNASTSAAIISKLEGDAGFAKLSQFEGDSIVKRDEEDAEKLQRGVDASIAKGVLPKLEPPPERGAARLSMMPRRAPVPNTSN